jgi:rhodanese-related sulfurtransferase
MIANATSPQSPQGSAKSGPAPNGPAQGPAQAGPAQAGSVGGAAAQAGAAAEYAGDLDPRAAWDLLARDKDAVLVDCRSRAEWSWVGMPDLSALGKRVIGVEWQRWSERGMQANQSFAGDLAAAGVSPAQPVVFLCRSGARSKSAAILMTRAGYARCFNLAGGFEGPHDGHRHRGTAAGWKVAGLPWGQE